MQGKNKKGNVAIFGFFFVLMIFASLFFFLSFGMHYILFDYALTPTEELADTILDTNGEAMQNIRNLNTDYLGLIDYYDILFLVIIVSAFIQSTYASIQTRERGFLSFFGFVTIGNIFLIFVLSIATKIQGWILNEVLFNVILITTETPVLTFFFNYSIYIAIIWYLWLLGVNQIDIELIKEKTGNLFSRNGGVTNSEGRFEE